MNHKAPRRLGRTLGQLVLALLNATLILVALCLFLGWQLTRSVERVTIATTEAAMQTATTRIAPLRDDVQGMTAELAALRADLAGLQESGTASASAAAARLQTRLDALDSRAEAVRAGLAPMQEALSADPGPLIDRAITSAMAEAGSWLVTLRGCTPPPAS